MSTRKRKRDTPPGGESGPPRITLHRSGSSDEGDEFEESEIDEQSGTDEESEIDEGEVYSLFTPIEAREESLRERGERWRREREAWSARDPRWQILEYRVNYRVN